MKFDFTVNDRMLGIILVILGAVVYQAMQLDLDAIARSLTNPNPQLSSAALPNLGAILITQAIGISNLVILTLMAIRFSSLARRLH
jgi:hypothetical protein